MGLPERIANSPTPGQASALTTLFGNGGSISSSALSMKVAAAAPTSLQGTGQCRVLVDSELIIIDTSTTSGTTWTIIARGAEGTTAAGHNDGAQVYHVWSADAISNKAVTSTNKPTVGKAYRSAAYTTPANTAAKVPLDAIAFDPGTNWDITTNHRYTCAVQGYYHVDFGVTPGATVTEIIAMIYKNGAEVHDGGDVGNDSSIGSGIIQCVANDYLELWLFTSTAIAAAVGSINGPFLVIVRVA